MDRRVSGGLILVIALLCALVVPKLLNPPRVAGVASIAPPPPAPAVGTCIDEALSGYGVTADGQLTAGAPITATACDARHHSEIVYLEDVLVPSVDPQNPTAAIDDFWSRCADRSSGVWGHQYPAPGAWRQQISFSIAVFGPDRQQFTAGQRWAACVVSPSFGELTNPLADLPRGEVPPELGDCAILMDAVEPMRSGIPCTFPHTSEVFATRVLEPGAALTQDDLDRSCASLVTAESGRAAIADDTSLAITAAATIWFAFGAPDASTLPVPADAAGAWATCEVRTVDERQLTSSLRQIGDAPIPWVG